MEGYLFKKGKGESSLGRRNWKRRWFVLEGSLLTYYDDLDLATGTPISQKGVNDVFGCEVLPINQNEKKFGFCVRDANKTPLYLQADDAKMMNTVAVNKPVDFDECYARLGLIAANNPTAAEINRSYRKAALKVHPDKGGDLAEFKKLQEAFEILMNKVEVEEENKNFTTVTYQAVIMKGPQGVGLGMVVIEEAKKGNIKVKRVMPDMNLESLTPEAGGEIRVGDILIGVGNENISKMPLSRVVQKISDFRIPVNTTVRLTFSRRLHLDGTPEDVEFENAPSVFTPTTGEDKSDEPSPAPESGNRPSGGGGGRGINSEPSGYNFNYSPPENSSVPPLSPQSSMRGDFTPTPPTHLDPVQYVAVMSENEELKNDLETSLHQLNQAYHDRDKLLDENRKVRNELAQCKAMLAEAGQRQKLLELQLEQSCIYGVITTDQLAQSLNDMMAISAKVQSDQPIEVSPELNSYMSSLGLTADKTDQIKASQRNAISASASIDKTGVMLQKWNLSGDSVLDKLSRFEETIQKLESHRPADAPRPVAATAAAARVDRKLSSTFDEAAAASAASASGDTHQQLPNYSVFIKSTILSPTGTKSTAPASSSSAAATAGGSTPVAAPSAAAAAYKGLAGGGAVRTPMNRAQSAMVGSGSSNSPLGSPGPEQQQPRVSKPLVFAKRPGPPQAPISRAASSIQ